MNKGGHCDGVSGCDVAIPNTCGIFVWEQSYIIHRICLISTRSYINNIDTYSGTNSLKSENKHKSTAVDFLLIKTPRVKNVSCGIQI